MYIGTWMALPWQQHDEAVSHVVYCIFLFWQIHRCIFFSQFTRTGTSFFNRSHGFRHTQSSPVMILIVLQFWELNTFPPVIFFSEAYGVGCPCLADNRWVWSQLQVRWRPSNYSIRTLIQFISALRTGRAWSLDELVFGPTDMATNYCRSLAGRGLLAARCKHR